MDLSRRECVPSILVIRRTRTLGRDHGCAQRIFRGAARPECGTIGGFLQALEHFRTNAFGGLLGSHSFGSKDAIGIECSIFLPEAEAAFRNPADAAPFPVTYLEHFRQYFLGMQVPLIRHGSDILVLDDRTPFLQLRH